LAQLASARSAQAPYEEPSPEKIFQVGLGFWGSKALLSAVELGVFTVLAQGSLEGEQLRQRLGLHPRGARDFFDALVSVGFLTAMELITATALTPTSSWIAKSHLISVEYWRCRTRAYMVFGAR
jgi:hypothetical protein